MITTTRSLIRNRRSGRPSAGFTLVEVMVSCLLSALILAAVLSTFLFLVRSGTNIRNYSDMESQARRALEIFAEDVRQASAITWTTNVSVTLTVNAANITYAYSSTDATFSRTDPVGKKNLITGVTSGTFKFRAYNIGGTELTLVSSADLTAAGVNTKQLQISLESSRTNQTVVAATNAVLSARFILRNKIVTA